MKEITLPQITKTVYILIIIAFLISLLMRNLSITIGIIIGSFVGLLNFKTLSLTTQKALKSKRTKLVVISSYWVRLIIITLVLSIILQIKAVNFIAVIVGLSIVILAIIITGIINIFIDLERQKLLTKINQTQIK